MITRKIRTASQKFEIQENRRLCWYACVFDAPHEVFDRIPGTKVRNKHLEVVRPGAFTDSLRDGRREVQATIDHNSKKRFALRSKGELILQEDPKGLWCSTYLPKNDIGDAILRDVEAGKLTGASFQADVRPGYESWNDDIEMVEVVKLDLFDVCLTDDPANPFTEVKLRTKNRELDDYWTTLKILKLKNKLRD